MLSGANVTKEPHQEGFKLPQNIPIAYIWFGKTVPEDYLISLSQLSYPVIFMKNPPIERQFSRELMNIQKSDYYRLQYLYDNGGLYSDFDNTIDYPCLMKLLQPYRNKNQLVFMTDNKHTRKKTKQTTTNLIFAPYPKMPLLKKMLDAIDQTKQKVWQFAGIGFVGQFQEPIQLTMKQCVNHTYDWSWFDASNEVLGKKSPPHSQYAKKLQKKGQIIIEKQRLDMDIKKQRGQKTRLQAQLRKFRNQNSKLKNQMNVSYNTLMQRCPSAAKVLESVGEKKLTNPSKTVLIKSQNQKQLSLSQQVVMVKLTERITQLEQRNRNLQFQTNMYNMQVNGAIIIVILMLLIAFLSLKCKGRAKQFKKVGNIQKQIIQQY